MTGSPASFWFIGQCIALLLLACANNAAAQMQVRIDSPESSPPAPAYRVSGPFVHQNLAVYLIHSDERDDREFITLDEGLKKKLILVTEKEDAEVNEQQTAGARSALPVREPGCAFPQFVKYGTKV